MASQGKERVWWRDTLVGVVLLGLAIWAVGYALESGVLDPVFKPQSAPAAGAPAQPAEAAPATAPTEAAASSVPAAEPVLATPQPVFSPTASPTAPALDSKTITEARIEMPTTSHNIAPGVVRVERNPGFYTVVVTPAGVLDSRDECYVHWTVQNNGETLDTGDSRCAPQPGWSDSFWPRVTYQPGTVRVIADISIADGEARSIEMNYEVR